jgi:endonuclease YncB( thermonuclease family)
VRAIYAPVAVALILSAGSSAAETVAGPARVIDGDTIDVAGQRIRILDIDAPERRQPCIGESGQSWACGIVAGEALRALIGSMPVICESDRRDRYSRLLATCSVGGADVAEQLAATGWAVPYRDCGCVIIRAAADRAKASQLGIWSGSFAMPWDWRKAH